jgi:hypothetical protein
MCLKDALTLKANLEEQGTEADDFLKRDPTTPFRISSRAALCL